jgi:Zn-dependent protease
MRTASPLAVLFSDLGRNTQQAGGAPEAVGAPGSQPVEMFPSISLGRIAGISVDIGWSWLLILAFVAWSLAANVFPSQDPHLSTAAYAVMGIVSAVLYLGSILLHELGHAFQARREGIEVDGISLWLLGGVSRFHGAPKTPGAEFRVAAAGPLVSLALGGLSVGVAQLVRSPVEVQAVAAWLGYANLLLFVFNVIPALPLDGGRVFHALLWRLKGDEGWATQVAAGAGRAFGYLLAAGGIALLVATKDYADGIWLVFVGWFLAQAATAESQQSPRAA